MNIDLSEVMRKHQEDETRAFLTQAPIEELNERLELLALLSLVETKKIVIHTLGIVAIAAALCAVNFTTWFSQAGLWTNLLLSAAMIAAVFKHRKAVAEHYQINYAKHLIKRAIDARAYCEAFGNQA